jgi:hypothetical protein
MYQTSAKQIAAGPRKQSRPLFLASSRFMPIFVLSRLLRVLKRGFRFAGTRSIKSLKEIVMIINRFRQYDGTVYGLLVVTAYKEQLRMRARSKEFLC